MTLAKTIQMEPLKKHLRYTLSTASVLNKKRSTSSLIIAPAERAKSTEVTKFDEAGCGLMYLSDFTSWGLRDLVNRMTPMERKRIHHLVLPDIERLSARGRNLRKQILADMRFIMEEGFIRVKTFNTDIDISDEPFQCAFIICTTKEDVSDGRSLYRKGNSFASRLVPFSYDFSNGMRESVLDFVTSEACFMKDTRESILCKSYDVDLPDCHKRTLKMCAKMLAKSTDNWTASKDALIGIRALENLQTYVKGISVYNGRQRVTDEDMDEFLWLFHWMNYNFYNIDEFEK